MYKIKHIINLVTAMLIMAGLSACTSTEKKKVTGTTAKVTEIIDGKTIKLSNNLTVRLLGVEDNPETVKFLTKNIKGKKVKLVADSKDSKQTYVMGDMSTVNAYVIKPGNRTLNSVNGRMIRTNVSKFIQKGVTDSIDAFSSGGGTLPDLTDSELLARLKPRTFMILHSDGSLGTGFYISSSGVALTNNHVLNYDNLGNTLIVPFNEDGNFDESNSRKIERILFTGDQSRTQNDFTIFEVSLNGEKVPFLKLAENHELDGKTVAKLGCVKGEPAHFSMGNISHTIDGIVSHSSRVNQGDSGSPLVNIKGEVIGINQSIKVNEQLGGDVGVFYAVDIQIIRDWFEMHRDDQGQLRYGQ